MEIKSSVTVLARYTTRRSLGSIPTYLRPWMKESSPADRRPLLHIGVPQRSPHRTVLRCYIVGLGLSFVGVLPFLTTLTQSRLVEARASFVDCIIRSYLVTSVMSLATKHFKREHEQKVSQQKVPEDRYGIVGGNSTIIRKYPHMGALGWKLGDDGKLMFLCGSTLISPYFIVTAGHCTSKAVRNEHVAPSIVRFGVTNINIKWCRYDVDVRKIIRHPDYKPPSKYYDIALILLDKEMTFNVYIKPACLWRSTDIVSSTASVTGWGTTHPRYANMSYLLKVAEISIIEDRICKSLVKPSRHFNGLVDHQLCAGSSGGLDSCKGDSGGPLQILVNSTYYIVGIISFGDGCGVPGIYTRVSSFVDWIEKIVWETGNDKK